MSYPIPRHWEFDRPVTFEEWEKGCEQCGREAGAFCEDCGIRFTSFAMVARRLCDESMTDIAFADDDVIPMYEIICTKCEGGAA